MQFSPCTGGTLTALSIEEGCEVNGLVFQSWLCCWLATPVSSSSPCPRNLFFKPVNQGISQDTSLQTTWQKILRVLVFGRVQIMLQMITWGVKVLVQAKAGSPFALYSGLCPSHSCARCFVALGRGDCFELSRKPPFLGADGTAIPVVSVKHTTAAFVEKSPVSCEFKMKDYLCLYGKEKSSKN